MYFYDLNDDENSDFKWAVYSANETGSEKKKVNERNWKEMLFVCNNYIFMNDYDGENVIICRISLDDGKVKNILEGRLNCIDRKSGNLYYSNSYDLNGEYITDIFKADINGENIKRICSGKYEFLHKDGDIIYLEDKSTSNAILASVKSDGSDLKIIAEIPLAYEDIEVENIVDFGVVDNWIFLSAGSYHGTGHFFYGGLVRMKKDGTEIERLLEETDKFYIIDDWVYFNYNPVGEDENEKYGCYRMKSDLSEKQYLGDKIGKLLTIDSNYLYGESDSEKEGINDLRQMNIEDGSIITLFEGKKAPVFDDSDYVGYYVEEKVGGFIYFSVWVHGYAEGESWRGHNCCTAFYRIRENGSDLSLLYQSNECTNAMLLN